MFWGDLWVFFRKIFKGTRTSKSRLNVYSRSLRGLKKTVSYSFSGSLAIFRPLQPGYWIFPSSFFQLVTKHVWNWHNKLSANGQYLGDHLPGLRGKCYCKQRPAVNSTFVAGFWKTSHLKGVTSFTIATKNELKMHKSGKKLVWHVLGQKNPRVVTGRLARFVRNSSRAIKSESFPLSLSIDGSFPEQLGISASSGLIRACNNLPAITTQMS